MPQDIVLDFGNLLSLRQPVARKDVANAQIVDWQVLPGPGSLLSFQRPL